MFLCHQNFIMDMNTIITDIDLLTENHVEKLKEEGVDAKKEGLHAGQIVPVDSRWQN